MMHQTLDENRLEGLVIQGDMTRLSDWREGVDDLMKGLIVTLDNVLRKGAVGAGELQTRMN